MAFIVRGERGFALVTALMLTLVSLAVIGALLQMLTAGIRLSGGQKRYRTATEAAYGGAEVVVADVIPQVFQGYSGGRIVSGFLPLSLSMPSASCLRQKLTLATADWPAACGADLSASSLPDLAMTLPSVSGEGFKVSAKIVDNVPGNTDTSGIDLDGAGVAETTSVYTPQHLPFMYRLEVAGEHPSASERATVSVLYAY